MFAVTTLSDSRIFSTSCANWPTYIASLPRLRKSFRCYQAVRKPVPNRLISDGEAGPLAESFECLVDFVHSNKAVQLLGVRRAVYSFTTTCTSSVQCPESGPLAQCAVSVCSVDLLYDLSADVPSGSGHGTSAKPAGATPALSRMKRLVHSKMAATLGKRKHYRRGRRL